MFYRPCHAINSYIWLWLMQKSEMRFFHVQHHISPNSSRICLIFREFLTNYDQIRTMNHFLVLIRAPWTKIYQKLILIILPFMVRLRYRVSMFLASFLPYPRCAVTMCCHRDRRAAKKIEKMRLVFTTHTRFRTALILYKRR